MHNFFKNHKEFFFNSYNENNSKQENIELLERKFSKIYYVAVCMEHAKKNGFAYHMPKTEELFENANRGELFSTFEDAKVKAGKWRKNTYNPPIQYRAHKEAHNEYTDTFYIIKVGAKNDLPLFRRDLQDGEFMKLAIYCGADFEKEILSPKEPDLSTEHNLRLSP